mmetsp:Transcript_51036/g.155211  ORF Transcript_51036/g.155211 Transcript_51036/m.155211 type:complete len:228 (-) Transcript_51036:164-847(-)
MEQVVVCGTGRCRGSRAGRSRSARRHVGLVRLIGLVELDGLVGLVGLIGLVGFIGLVGLIGLVGVIRRIGNILVDVAVDVFLWWRKRRGRGRCELGRWDVLARAPQALRLEPTDGRLLVQKVKPNPLGCRHVAVQAILQPEARPILGALDAQLVPAGQAAPLQRRGAVHAPQCRREGWEWPTQRASGSWQRELPAARLRGGHHSGAIRGPHAQILAIKVLWRDAVDR